MDPPLASAGKVSVLCVADNPVYGVTQLRDVVYMVCIGSSTILRFSATTLQQLTDIDVKDLSDPWDIAACEQTSQVYVSDYDKCVWRVSADGADIKHWLPKSPSDALRPWTLSVTSTRLLVTSHYTRQLTQFNADGDELKRVQLPDHAEAEHAVESPTGNFIVGLYNRQLKQGQVVEVNTGGEVLREFSGSRLRSVRCTWHIAVDSRGNIFATDEDNCRILLLDAHLSLRRVIIDEHRLSYKQPYCLCYREESGQLLVGLAHDGGVAVFDVLCR